MEDDGRPSGRDAPWFALAVSALNGAVGDYLHGRGNPLAITMACYHRGRPLPMSDGHLREAHPKLTPKICLLVHGLACNEDVWRFRAEPRGADAVSYGSLLRDELGYTPLYARYNTGVRIAENGRSLAALLDRLDDCYPVPIEEIVLIGHSMGGLVLRSACHEGSRRRAGWVPRVSRVFYVGTPHQGAALEQISAATTSVLGAIDNPVTQLIGTIFNLRSQGIKDLRLGSLVDEREHEPARSAPGGDRRPVVPWLASAEHYLIAGSLTSDPNHLAARLLGDMLVDLTSAHGAAAEADSHAHVPVAHMAIVPGVHHLDLARNPEVYRHIRAWCAALPPSGATPHEL